jgi:hypothetical protein
MGYARNKVLLEHLRDQMKIVELMFATDAGVIEVGLPAFQIG